MMMVKKMMMLGMMMTFLSAAGYGFAQDVFITPNGAKYHKEICNLVKNKDNVTKLDLQEAVEEGYGPCRRCFKEEASLGGQDHEKGGTKAATQKKD